MSNDMKIFILVAVPVAILFIAIYLVEHNENLVFWSTRESENKQVSHDMDFGKLIAELTKESKWSASASKRDLQDPPEGSYLAEYNKKIAVEREEKWRKEQEERRTRAMEAGAIAEMEQAEALRRLEQIEINREIEALYLTDGTQELTDYEFKYTPFSIIETFKIGGKEHIVVRPEPWYYYDNDDEWRYLKFEIESLRLEMKRQCQ